MGRDWISERARNVHVPPVDSRLHDEALAPVMTPDFKTGRSPGQEVSDLVKPFVNCNSTQVHPHFLGPANPLYAYDSQVPKLNCFFSDDENLTPPSSIARSPGVPQKPSKNEGHATRPRRADSRVKFKAQVGSVYCGIAKCLGPKARILCHASTVRPGTYVTGS